MNDATPRSRPDSPRHRARFVRCRPNTGDSLGGAIRENWVRPGMVHRGVALVVSYRNAHVAHRPCATEATIAVRSHHSNQSPRVHASVQRREGDTAQLCRRIRTHRRRYVLRECTFSPRLRTVITPYNARGPPCSSSTNWARASTTLICVEA